MAAEYSKDEESTDPNHIIVWNVNLLCVVGACIGVAAVFLTWIHEPPSMLGPRSIHYEPTIVYMVVTQYLYYGAATMFLLGTVAAFASPVGGIPQLASLMLFAQGIVESGDDPWLDGIDPQQRLRIGMYLGMASCFLVLSGLLSPLGTGKLRPGRCRSIRLVERFLTVSQSMR